MFCKINFFAHSSNGKDSGINHYTNSIQGCTTINVSLVSSFDSLVKKQDDFSEEGYFMYSKLVMNNGNIFYIDDESYEKLDKFIAKINTK